MYQVLYHTDIVKKLGGFSAKVENTDKYFSVIETIAAHRLANLKHEENAESESEFDQVLITLAQYHSGSFHEIAASSYYPETMNGLDDDGKPIESALRTNILSLCAEGSFIPYILPITEETLANGDNILVLMGGIGDHPDRNFIVTTINVPDMLTKCNVNTDELNDGSGRAIYPLIFDAVRKIVVNLLEDETIHTRSFLFKEDVEPEETKTEE